jgi:hypothetical protein
MSPDTPRNMRTQARELFELSKLKKPTIKILLYTDAPTEVVRAPVGRFGLGRMIQQLEAHAPAFADVSVKWAGRYSPGSKTADNKIHVVMNKEVLETKEPFDEIWFFGVHQINKEGLDLRVGGGGGPESELTEEEVVALKKWMDAGGGVLVTGDHANERPLDAIDKDPNPRCPDKFRKAKFLGLGRALGRCIPRAGLMRDWEGPPTSREQDSNDTQIITSGDFDDFGDQIFFQRDPIPQQLILTTFDELGFPSVGGQPHPLFFYRPGHPILLFPDHLHEGEVTVSQGRQSDVWPTNPFKPLPQVVAFGTDKRSGKRIKIIAAYDGDGANVGRIVADSSWHHYFNINLARFEQPATKDSASDEIGQFYGNLALWLCPARKRLEMAAVMARTLARDPLIMEEIGLTLTNDKTNKFKAGMLGHHVLSSLASPCEIHELLNITIPDLPRHLVPSTPMLLAERRSESGFLPSQESLLANLITQYPEELLEHDESTLSDAARSKIKTAFSQSWDNAFADQHQQFERTAEFRERFLIEVENKITKLSDKKK